MGFITIASLVSAAPYELVRINNTCKHIELCVLLIASMLVTYMKQYNYYNICIYSLHRSCSPFLYFESTLVLLLMFVECDCRDILRACVCSLSGCLLL